LQAAVLRVKLKYLDEWNERRKRLAAIYLEGLSKATVVLPSAAEWADPVWHLFVVRSADRQALQEQLHKAGIATLIHYPIPPYLQAAYTDLGYGAKSFPVAECMADEVLSLP